MLQLTAEKFIFIYLCGTLRSNDCVHKSLPQGSDLDSAESNNYNGYYNNFNTVYQYLC
jgi:hypothetical protein